MFSGRGVQELRRFLLRAYAEEPFGTQYGELHAEVRRAFLDMLEQRAQQQRAAPAS